LLSAPATSDVADAENSAEPRAMDISPNATSSPTRICGATPSCPTAT